MLGEGEEEKIKYIIKLQTKYFFLGYKKIIVILNHQNYFYLHLWEDPGHALIETGI